MASIGHYELCAAEGPVRAGEMFTNPAYQAAGWGLLRARVNNAKVRVEKAGGSLDFVVVKYPFGQGSSADSAFVAEPGFLDILAMRDCGAFNYVIGREAMRGRYGMSIFAKYCETRRIRPFVYLGKAPEEHEVLALAESDVNMEILSGWINAMTGAGIEMIIDSSSHDSRIDATRELIRLLRRCGLSRESQVHFEAFMENEPEPLNGAVSLQFGENAAWIASGMPSLADVQVLLHTGSTAAAEAIEALSHPRVWGVAANINGMSDEVITAMVNAKIRGDSRVPDEEE